MSAQPFDGKTVRSAMQLGLFSCPPDTDLRALARMMVERSIHWVVVRGLREGYGIVSDLDLLAGLEEPRAPSARLTSCAPTGSRCGPTRRSRPRRT